MKILKLTGFLPVQLFQDFNTSNFHVIFYMKRNEPEQNLSWAGVLAGCWAILLFQLPPPGLHEVIILHTGKMGRCQKTLSHAYTTWPLPISSFRPYPSALWSVTQVRGPRNPSNNFTNLSPPALHASIVNASLTNHVHKTFSWDFTVIMSSLRHFTAGNLSCVVKQL